ncbi:Uncharacterised protein [Bordetella pertussis]|nr:Uncharacterised protein [Bordetella pertussis]CFO76833.1 Uncharacterised protein [Bordetella pertussis]CFT94400.1 Uncharacterised protein [Bordetella pertussis]CFU86161.1 Uncharacterised protein [Bordetella pertussis]CFW14826.1 Uncharacterised protein [Bordetella pertussis]
MLIFFWRNVSRSRLFRLTTSTPSTRIWPALGSIRRLKWRMSVDLPDPDSPMIT